MSFFKFLTTDDCVRGRAYILYFLNPWAFCINPSAFHISDKDSFRATSESAFLKFTIYIRSRSFFYINYLKITLSILNKSVLIIIYLIVYISCTFVAQLLLVQLALSSSLKKGNEDTSFLDSLYYLTEFFPIHNFSYNRFLILI